MIEVEVKYWLSDAAKLERLVCEQFQACFVDQVQQTDIYFHHPCRDYDQTDEAIRVRTIVSADGNVRSQVCYKGPRLDAATKTRSELQCDLAMEAIQPGASDGTADTTSTAKSADAMTAVLKALGFKPAGIVRKVRRTFAATFESGEVVIAIDLVDGLGCYVELEIVCEETFREFATQQILRLAERLELKDCERRSYLELVEIRGTH